MKLRGRIKITAVLTTKTGLHVGGQREAYEIGGLDNPVIKIKRKGENGLEEEPYVPGSSLKGKLRSLLEEAKGKITDENECSCGKCEICILFGKGMREGEKDTGVAERTRTRLRVRDAYLIPDEFLKKNDYVELKMENKIRRREGKAENPRDQERVVPGTKFSTDFLINLYEGDDTKKFVQLLCEGLALLEDDYLGGSGSRGYGQVAFSKIEFYVKSVKAYEKGGDFQLLVEYPTVRESLAAIDQIVKMVEESLAS